MNSEILLKVDDFISEVENSDEFKRFLELKKVIKSSSEIKDMMDKFHEEEKNIYSNSYVEIKRKILENEIVFEYKKLEKEISFLILELNNKLESLIE